MTTALTVYPTSTNDTLVTTARQLASTAPATETSTTTKVAKSTGWGELCSQGNTGNWAAGASAPAPSGQGFLWDVTTLEAQRILAGTWTPKIKLSASSALTAHIHMRAYKRSSAGVYTQIGDFVLSSQSIGTTATAYSLTTQPLSAVQFGAGDKLYVDVLLQITVAGGSTTGTVSLFQNGGANESLATPGYAPVLSVSVTCAGASGGTAMPTSRASLTAMVSGHSGIAVTSTRLAHLSAACAGASSGSASPTLQHILSLTATCTGAGGAAAALSKRIALAATMAGTGSATVSSTTRMSLVATVAGTSGTVVTVSSRVLLAATCAGISGATVAASKRIPLACAVAGVSAIQATIRSVAPLMAAISGTSGAMATTSSRVNLAATVAGNSAIAVSIGSRVQLAVTCQGASGALATPMRIVSLAAACQGVGSAQATFLLSGGGIIQLTATLTGTSRAAAQILIILPLTATMSGLADAAASPSCTAVLAAACTGQGTITAAPSAIARLHAALLGQGVIACVPALHSPIHDSGLRLRMPPSDVDARGCPTIAAPTARAELTAPPIDTSLEMP